MQKFPCFVRHRTRVKEWINDKRQQKDRQAAMARRLLTRPTPKQRFAAPLGLQPLGLDAERDAFIYVPTSYQASRPAPKMGFSRDTCIQGTRCKVLCATRRRTLWLFMGKFFNWIGWRVDSSVLILWMPIYQLWARRVNQESNYCNNYSPGVQFDTHFGIPPNNAWRRVPSMVNKNRFY